MKQPKKRALRADAQNDYAKLLSAIARWREGGQLQPAEGSIVRTICEDVVKGRNPAVRFFEPVEGQRGSYEQLVIAVDYRTIGGNNRGKAVGKRWNLSSVRVRGIAGEHKDTAVALIESMGVESSRAFVEQILTLKKV